MGWQLSLASLELCQGNSPYFPSTLSLHSERRSGMSSTGLNVGALRAVASTHRTFEVSSMLAFAFPLISI